MTYTRPSTTTCSALASGAIHVWRVHLAASAAQSAQFSATLSTDERARAARYHFEKDMRQFSICRGALRTLLGMYLGCCPQSIEFRYNDYGKPELALAEKPQLQFNVSHSGDLALIALARQIPIGVDLEQMRQNIDVMELAVRFFSPPEIAALQSLDSARRFEGFYHCWTRKEAYIKACGKGLSMPLDQFTVPFIPGMSVTSTMSGWAGEQSRWTFHTLYPADGYASALAYNASAAIVHYFTL